jgi:hypothetical protein
VEELIAWFSLWLYGVQLVFMVRHSFNFKPQPFMPKFILAFLLRVGTVVELLVSGICIPISLVAGRGTGASLVSRAEKA